MNRADWWMGRRRILLLGILALLGGGACGSDPAPEIPSSSSVRSELVAEAHVDRSRALPGEKITLTITVDHHPSVRVELPEFGASLPGLRVVDQQVKEPRTEGGRTILTRVYTLTADLSGTYIVPPFSLPYQGKDGKEGSASTGQILVVFGAGEDPTASKDGKPASPGEGLRDIAQPLPPEADWRFLPMVVASLLGILALLLGVWGWRKKRATAVVPPPLPHEAARAALDALQARDWLARGLYKPFAFALSEILREYLEGRFGFPAVESTAEEILSEIKKIPDLAPPQREAWIGEVLLGTDQVKFADREVLAQQLLGWTSQVRFLVEETLPPPPLPPEPPPRRTWRQRLGLGRARR